MNTLHLPDDATLAGKVIDARASQDAARLEMEWFGRVFGTRGGAASNAALLVVLCAVPFLGYMMLYGNDTTGFTRKDAVTAITSLVTLALGFLFGKSVRG